MLWCYFGAEKQEISWHFFCEREKKFKFAWADGTACIVEQLWGGDAHRSVNFDIEKLQLHTMEHINRICMKEGVYTGRRRLVCRSLFDSVRTKCIYIEPDESQKPKLVVILRCEFRPVGSVSLSKLYRRVGVWRPFSAVDRWVWRLIEILSEIEAWSKRPCLKNVNVSSGELWRTYFFTGLNILHSAD